MEGRERRMGQNVNVYWLLLGEPERMMFGNPRGRWVNDIVAIFKELNGSVRNDFKWSGVGLLPTQ